MKAGLVTLFILCAMLMAPARAAADIGTTIAISAELGTSIAGELFPETIELTAGNLFLTQPKLLYLDNGRVGLQLQFQAYDHRPAQGVAISETGYTEVSGTLGYDSATRQVLLHNPRLDTLEFDRKTALTDRLRNTLKADWSAQLTNPIRAELPPHPYLLPFRNNIADIAYDGKNINLKILYQ